MFRRPWNGRFALDAIAALIAAMAFVVPATFPTRLHAQAVGEQMFGGSGNAAQANQQMLLEADQLVYSNNNETVEAVGNVQIAYNDYTLVAQRVTYSRATGRVIAQGDVEIVQPDGSRIFAEEIDITDDFSDGFVSALRVETADNTRFAAESAERRDGEIAVFNNGVYTACEPCKENPEKPPLWQIRAERVIINNRTKRVEYEGASFELWGKPIAYMQRFSHADPSIKRKSGFLFPSISFSENKGVGIRGSYFWAPAPNYDVTINETWFSRQGFLTEAEWRHRLANGTYSVRFAGINQKDPGAFDNDTIDYNEEDRLALMTTGQFRINPRWVFGWNALFQTDENFARTYNLEGFSSNNVTNEIYLTGLAGKNYFDLRGQKFLVQDNLVDQVTSNDGNPLGGSEQKLQDEQANALPILDYNWVSDEAVAGGQVSFDMNLQNLYRHNGNIYNYDGLVTQGKNERYYGIAGNSTRLSVEAEWKASEVYGGAVMMASLSGRGDGMMKDLEDPYSVTNPLPDNDNLARGMVSGMLEIRYPLVARDGYATHLFEPIAQIIVRPNETQIGKFVNEDAQSFVFDTSNLFERDKYSGYDRVEGGTRANVGFRYSSSFSNGASIDVVAGQSYHVAGQNSFAQQDLVNAGLDSGLDTDASDYVASAYVNNGQGFLIGAGGRFDQSNLAFRRGEVSARYVNPLFGVAASYVFIDSQEQYGFDERRHEVNGSGSVKVTDTWRAFASFSYDLEENNLYQRGIGLAYDDSCFSFSVAYAESEDRYTGESSDASVMFRMGLRTIGDYDYKYSLNDDQN
jgi:LPS-assembly protein